MYKASCIELRTPHETQPYLFYQTKIIWRKREILIVKEFLFGDVQIGFKSKGLLYKVSCIELGTPHETKSYLFYHTKIQIWEWGRKRFWEEEDRWNPIYKPMLSAWCYSLYPCLFFFFSLCLCSVCVIALFLYFRLSLFFFLFVCPPSIYRETPKEFFPYFSLNWSDHGAVFSSTFPNSMLSHDPLFSFLLFLFVPLLFKLPLFGLWHPHFSAFRALFHETLLLTFKCCHFPFTFFFFFLN